MKVHLSSETDAKDEVKKCGERLFATSVFLKGQCVRRGIVWYEAAVRRRGFDRQSRISSCGIEFMSLYK